MIEFIITLIFVCSLGGALFILARKMPALISLPQNGGTGIRKHHIILNAENKIKDFFLAIEKQIFLHKFLSWVKVITLKIETRVDRHLHKIRKKAQEVAKERNKKK